MTSGIEEFRYKILLSNKTNNGTFLATSWLVTIQ